MHTWEKYGQRVSVAIVFEVLPNELIDDQVLVGKLGLWHILFVVPHTHTHEAN